MAASESGPTAFREQIGGLVYRTATLADADAMWRLMLSDFYPRMPLFRHLGVNCSSDVDVIYGLLPGLLAHGVTIVAEDPAEIGELVGARTATVVERDAPAPRHPLVVDPELAGRYPKLSIVTRLVDHVAYAADVLKRYDCSRYLSLRFLVVRESHAGHGVGRSLIDCCLRHGRELGLELAVGTTQNFYAQKIFQSLDFDAIYSTSIPEFVDPLTGEKPFKGLAGTEHTETFCFAKRLL